MEVTACTNIRASQGQQTGSVMQPGKSRFRVEFNHFGISIQGAFALAIVCCEEQQEPEKTIVT